MLNEVTIKIGELDKQFLSDLLYHQEVYTQMVTILKVIQGDRCKSLLIEKKFERIYGLDKTSTLATLVQSFYEMGREDAIEDLKNKL